MITFYGCWHYHPPNIKCYQTKAKRRSCKGVLFREASLVVSVLWGLKLYCCPGWIINAVTTSSHPTNIPMGLLILAIGWLLCSPISLCDVWCSLMFAEMQWKRGQMYQLAWENKHTRAPYGRTHKHRFFNFNVILVQGFEERNANSIIIYYLFCHLYKSGTEYTVAIWTVNYNTCFSRLVCSPSSIYSPVIQGFFFYVHMNMKPEARCKESGKCFTFAFTVHSGEDVHWS